MHVRQRQSSSFMNISFNILFDFIDKREIELGESLRDARIMLASLPSASSRPKYEYKTRLGRASSASRSYGSAYSTTRRY